MAFILLSVGVAGCIYNTEFTKCENGKRSALISTADCEYDDYLVVQELNCDFTCAAGYYLAVDPVKKTQICRECESGSYSVGGGTVFDSWNLNRHKIVSYCWVLEITGWEFDKECIGWHSSEDEYLITGRTSLNKWFENEVIFYTSLVKPGSLHVTYRKQTSVKTGEDPGEFMIYVDGALKYMDFSSDRYNWYQAVIPLSYGAHEIELIFNSYSTNRTNEIQIREVQIRGTEFSSKSCQMCSFGSSSKGADSCKICGFGSYLEDGTCKTCPNGTFSLEGSAGKESCKSVENCTEKDYHFRYSDCTGNKKSKIYEWNFPLMCNNTGIDLPLTTEVSCTTCKKGTVIINNKCSYCQQGFFINEKLPDRCERCPQGKSAPKVKYYYSWDEIPEDFKTSCSTGKQYDCDFGWEARENYIVSSPFYQAGWSVHLQKSILVSDEDCKITFKAQVQGSAVLKVFSDKVLELSIANSENKEYTIKLSLGERHIRWMCEHYSGSNEACIIIEITIYGSEEGGATSCNDCKVGYISKGSQSSCLPCQEGFTSNADRTSCVQCEGNTYSYNPGPCLECPAPLQSDPYKRFCYIPQEVVLSDQRFLLSKLVGKVTDKSDYCKEPKMEMSCFQSYFGPVSNHSDFFYLSVGKPSLPDMPSFGAFDDDLAYAVALVPRNELTAEQREILKPENTCWGGYGWILINLGSVISSISKTEDGFKVTYSEGDFCTQNNRYKTEIRFLCDRKELEGWPVLISATDCQYTFVWPTIHACFICKNEDVVRKRSQCIDDKMTVHITPNASCVFENFTYSTVVVEDCKSGSFYTSHMFIVAVFILIFMIGIAVFMCYLTVQTKVRYQKLDQHSDTSSLSIDDYSPRSGKRWLNTFTKNKS